jgi:AcrR family transcriptional regulator
MKAAAPKPSEPARLQSSRRQQAEERRAQLLDAALVLFAERGVRGTTIREIAATVGVTEGLIYHYFPSKVALVRAVVDRHSFVGEMSTLMAEVREAPVRDALLRVGLAMLDLLSRNRKFVVMMVAETQRDPEIAAELGRMISQGFHLGRTFFADRIERGELRPHDPTYSLRLFHHSLFWFFYLQEQLSPPLPVVDREQFVRGCVDLLMKGVEPR